MDIIENIRSQPRSKLVIATLIITALFYIVFFNPYDDEYYEEVEEEIVLARAICENSVEWVLENKERMKLSKNTLDHISVNGKHVELKHIKYPAAVYLHNGYAHPGSQIEFYCTFKDPRGNSGPTYYYDYRKRLWVDKTISRR